MKCATWGDDILQKSKETESEHHPQLQIPVEMQEPENNKTKPDTPRRKC